MTLKFFDAPTFSQDIHYVAFILKYLQGNSEYVTLDSKVAFQNFYMLGAKRKQKMSQNLIRNLSKHSFCKC